MGKKSRLKKERREKTGGPVDPSSPMFSKLMSRNKGLRIGNPDTPDFSMSKVILDVLNPDLASAESPEECVNAIKMGILVWNIIAMQDDGNLDVSELSEDLQEVLRSPEIKIFMKTIRKQRDKLYPGIGHLITDFEIRMEKDGPRLVVAYEILR